MSLRSIFADVFAIPEETVTDTLQLREIRSWDSMSHMVLIARVEEAFDVQFTGDEIADFRTFGDLARALERHKENEAR